MGPLARKGGKLGAVPTTNGSPSPNQLRRFALPANYPPSGAPMLLGVVSAALGGRYQINATRPTYTRPCPPASVARPR